MIRKLVRGERQISLLGAGLAVATILVGSAVVGTVAYALDTASTANTRAKTAVDAERNTLTAIVAACESRYSYDARMLRVIAELEKSHTPAKPINNCGRYRKLLAEVPK